MLQCMYNCSAIQIPSPIISVTTAVGAVSEVCGPECARDTAAIVFPASARDSASASHLDMLVKVGGHYIIHKPSNWFPKSL